MDTSTYQRRLQARRAEWAAMQQQRAAGDGATPAGTRPGHRKRRAQSARARSARRWLDDDDRPDQEERANQLHVLPGGGE
jgi:hypothetical protein